MMGAMLFTKDKDALGQALLSHLRGGNGLYAVERDDGYISIADAKVHFMDYADWPSRWKEAVSYAKGNILDLACGAGMFSKHLQDIGYSVAGVDWSQLCVEVSKERGVKDVRFIDMSGLKEGAAEFDTILLLANGFGWLGNRATAPALLDSIARIAKGDARIIFEALDPYATSEREHTIYHALNASRGRSGGELQLRLRYGMYNTGWFNFLFASKKEMEGIVEDSKSWRLDKIIAEEGPYYIAMLRKEISKG